MAVDQEVAVGRRFVLADPRLEDRPLGEVGKAPAQVGARQAQVVRIGDPLAVRRVEARTDAVDADLEAPLVDARDPVAAARVVRPGRQDVPAPASVALARAEVEDRLPGDRHEIADDVGEELRQPGPCREDERTRAPPAARLVHDVEEAAAFRSARPHRRQPVGAARALERGDRGRDAPPRHQEARLRLEDAERGAGRIDHGPACRDLVGAQPLDGDPERSQGRFGVGLPAGVGPGEPEDTRPVHEADGPFLLEALPVAERAACPACVEAVRPVRAPDDAMLVARRGSQVPGAPCVEERHAPAAAPILVGSCAAGLRPERGPCAHDAGADHAHVGRRRKVGRARRCRLGHGARIGVVAAMNIIRAGACRSREPPRRAGWRPRKPRPPGRRRGA